jgi:hypothetical protein
MHTVQEHVSLPLAYVPLSQGITGALLCWERPLQATGIIKCVCQHAPPSCSGSAHPDAVGKRFDWPAPTAWFVDVPDEPRGRRLLDLAG